MFIFGAGYGKIKDGSGRIFCGVREKTGKPKNRRDKHEKKDFNKTYRGGDALLYAFAVILRCKRYVCRARDDGKRRNRD